MLTQKVTRFLIVFSPIGAATPDFGFLNPQILCLPFLPFAILQPRSFMGS